MKSKQDAEKSLEKLIDFKKCPGLKISAHSVSLANFLNHNSDRGTTLPWHYMYSDGFYSPLKAVFAVRGTLFETERNVEYLIEKGDDNARRHLMLLFFINGYFPYMLDNKLRFKGVDIKRILNENLIVGSTRRKQIKKALSRHRVRPSNYIQEYIYAKFIEDYANSAGKAVNRKELASALGISTNTLGRWYKCTPRYMETFYRDLQEIYGISLPDNVWKLYPSSVGAVLKNTTKNKPYENFKTAVEIHLMTLLTREKNLGKRSFVI